MSDRTSLLGPITSALLVLSAITGHFVARERVSTHRPFAAMRGNLVLPGGQNVDARLWQDPLAAVIAAKSERTPEQARKYLSSRIAEHLATDESSKKTPDEVPETPMTSPTLLTILPVLIPGGDYAEDSEVRRRYRVAVVSALMNAEYIPSSTEHIGSFLFEPLVADGLEVEPMPIPYEWFERSRFSKNPHGPRAVLVMWLPERALGSDPLLGGEHVVCEPLTDLVAKLDATQRAAEIQRLQQHVCFRVIGPSNSNTLAAMVDSLVRRRAANAKAEPELTAEEAENIVNTRLGLAPNTVRTWTDTRLKENKSGSRAILNQAVQATEQHRYRVQMQSRQQANPTQAANRAASEFLTNYLDTEAGKPAEPDVYGWLWGRNPRANRTGSRAAMRDEIVRALTPKARILSPRATVPDKHLLAWARKEPEQKIPDTLPKLFGPRNTGTVFTRTNCTDDMLAAAVLDELELRGVRPGTDRIALVIERDTLYGRTLEQTFEDAITNHLHAKSSQTTDAPDGVEVFSYLRGIDGITPATSANAPRARGPNARRNPDVEDVVRGVLDSSTGLPPNHAFGPSQFDRVLQLADTIAHRGNSTIASKGKAGAFRAIGIVGSDIYDKLAILQALKPRFPDQVFFTTDLDARLVPNDLTPFTQNLVVVSGFGHELAPCYQGGAAAFRDSYQSAVFLATLLGVDHLDPAELESLTPRVFEMGRSRAIELASKVKRHNLHPPIESFEWRPRPTFLGIAFLVLAAMVGHFAWNRGRRELNRLTDQTVKTRPHVFVIGLLATGILLLLAIAGAAGFLLTRHGEPFYWTQGVSMWPTQFVRIGASAAGVAMLWLGLVRIRHSDAGLGHRFFGSAAEPNATWPRKPLELWRACRLWRCDELAGAAPAAAWKLYRELGHPLPRLIRIVPYLLLALGIATAALLLQPAPRPPYRGDYAYCVDFAVGSFSVLVTIFLALAVADCARLSSALTRMLEKAKGKWPDGIAANELRDEHALQDADLADHLRIDVTSQRTAAVGRLFWYPFAVMALMTFGQYSTFDAWHWPVPFVALMAGLAIAVFVSGILLLQAARRSRDEALDRMHRRISQLAAHDEPTPIIKKHERLLAAAKQIDTSAFGGLRSPMVDAVLLPSGGLAVLSLLELLAVVMAG